MNSSQNWLLLRGLGRESAHWGEFLPQLQQAFPLATIHALDLPGSGHLNHLTSPATVEALVQMARRQAVNEGMLNQPVVLLGLSLGGMIAWQWMYQYPADVSAAVLINSSFANLSPFYRRLSWRAYSGMARIIAAQSDAQRERLIVSLVSNQGAEKRAMIARRWTELRQQRPMSARNEIRQIVAAARFKPGLQPPRQPVLLLNSLGDRLVSPSCSVAIQQQYGLPLITHPTAGHDLPADDGAWVVRQLQDWRAN